LDAAKEIIALGYYSRKYGINIDVLELATEAEVKLMKTTVSRLLCLRPLL